MSSTSSFFFFIVLHVLKNLVLIILVDVSNEILPRPFLYFGVIPKVSIALHRLVAK